jgi:hypothetical protein
MSTKKGRFGDPRKRAHAYVDLRAALNPAGVNIAACRPVHLPPELLAALPDGVNPAPMMDDTIRECAECGQDCWVGPVKLSLVDAGKAVVMCMMCAVRVTGGTAPVVDLNPGRDERPRR